LSQLLTESGKSGKGDDYKRGLIINSEVSKFLLSLQIESWLPKQIRAVFKKIQTYVAYIKK
jgi:hypothetical protein